MKGKEPALTAHSLGVRVVNRVTQTILERTSGMSLDVLVLQIRELRHTTCQGQLDVKV